MKRAWNTRMQFRFHFQQNSFWNQTKSQGICFLLPITTVDFGTHSNSRSSDVFINYLTKSSRIQCHPIAGRNKESSVSRLPPAWYPLLGSDARFSTLVRTPRPPCTRMHTLAHTQGNGKTSCAGQLCYSTDTWCWQIVMGLGTRAVPPTAILEGC